MGNRGLGRGLSSLIATGESIGGLRFEELPLSVIRTNPHQPRRHFSHESIKELAESIREVGILQPLVVREAGRGFEIIAGERRFRAAKETELEKVPVLIREAGESQSMQLALVENLQREDLNPLETASAYQALMESFGLSRDQLAVSLGKSRSAVANTLRLAQLPASVQEMVAEGKLSEGHARAILAVEDEQGMLSLSRRVVEQQLSVRKTEELVKEYLGGTEAQSEQPGSGENPEVPQEFDEASRMIQDSLTLPTRIRPMKKGGKLEIRFKSSEELEALLELLAEREGGDREKGKE